MARQVVQHRDKMELSAMAEIDRLSKKYYKRVVEITTGTEYKTDIERMGALFAVMSSYMELMGLTFAEMEIKYYD